MIIKFPSEVFEWLKDECANISPARFVVELVQQEMINRGSQ